MIIILIVLCLMGLHISFQLKTSNEMIVYEMDFPAKIKLETACDMKQPILFLYEDMSIEEVLTYKEYKKFKVDVYDEAYAKSTVTLKKALKLKNHALFHNETFLKDTLLFNYYKISDALLRPPMTWSSSYDICMGSDQYVLPLQFKKSYRNYILVIQGSIQVKVSPPRNKKFLSHAINPWKNTKVKFLDVTMTKGHLLFIPAYWWYSIKLEKDACVCMFHYRTIMNELAIVWDECNLIPAGLFGHASSDGSRTSMVLGSRQ
jgi:hypothetical protein